MTPIFITGIGTEVGKTLAAAIVAEALQADYWKPVQAGFAEGTDSGRVLELLSNPVSIVHPEAYKLSLPASPHVSAREEGLEISLAAITQKFGDIEESYRLQATSCKPGVEKGGNENKGRFDPQEHWLVIEGAGGLMVPLNDREFVSDLVKALDATVILVSRNYLGSINHSLLTTEVCRSKGIRVAGWIFNDKYGQYEEEIVRWSGYPAIASIGRAANPDRAFVREQAEKMRDPLRVALRKVGG